MFYSFSPTVLVILSTLLPCTIATTRPNEPNSKESSPGCENPIPTCKTLGGVSGSCYIQDFTTSAGGPKRKFIYHVPKNYDSSKPAPLIFSFHGHGKNAENQELLSQFSDEAYNQNAIAVYPDGLTTAKSPDAQGWQGDYRHNDTDDKGFTMDMLTYFNKNFCIDNKRVYATGKSNGGGFTSVLACDPVVSNSFAAFAPVAGAYYIGVEKSVCNTAEERQTIPIPCSPGRIPLPILEFHGGEDQQIPYAGGYQNSACLPTIPHFIREWSERLELGHTNLTTDSDGHQVHTYVYGNDTNRGILTHIKIDPMGHSWPSKSPNSDNKTATLVEGTEVIMEFFGRWTL